MMCPPTTMLTLKAQWKKKFVEFRMASLACDELVVMGMEGSANKIGVGLVTSTGRVLSNPRRVRSFFVFCFFLLLTLLFFRHISLPRARAFSPVKRLDITKHTWWSWCVRRSKKHKLVRNAWQPLPIPRDRVWGHPCVQWQWWQEC